MNKPYRMKAIPFVHFLNFGILLLFLTLSGYATQSDPIHKKLTGITIDGLPVELIKEICKENGLGSDAEGKDYYIGRYCHTVYGIKETTDEGSNLGSALASGYIVFPLDQKTKEVLGVNNCKEYMSVFYDHLYGDRLGLTVQKEEINGLTIRTVKEFTFAKDWEICDPIDDQKYIAAESFEAKDAYVAASAPKSNITGSSIVLLVILLAIFIAYKRRKKSKKR